MLTRTPPAPAPTVFCASRHPPGPNVGATRVLSCPRAAREPRGRGGVSVSRSRFPRTRPAARPVGWRPSSSSSSSRGDTLAQAPAQAAHARTPPPSVCKRVGIFPEAPAAFPAASPYTPSCTRGAGGAVRSEVSHRRGPYPGIATKCPYRASAEARGVASLFVRFVEDQNPLTHTLQLYVRTAVSKKASAGSHTPCSNISEPPQYRSFAPARDRCAPAAGRNGPGIVQPPQIEQTESEPEPARDRAAHDRSAQTTVVIEPADCSTYSGQVHWPSWPSWSPRGNQTGGYIRAPFGAHNGPGPQHLRK